MDEPSKEIPAVRPPQGIYDSRVDDKGRLKLPADFLPFFHGLPEKTLFVTSLDRRIAQIYPMRVWRENLNFFETFRADPGAAQRVAFTANDLGAEVEMDGQGRVLLPAKLRRELNMENQPVHVFAFKRRIEILNDATYQEMRRTSAATAEADANLLQQQGLN